MVVISLSDTRCQFHQRSMYRFYICRSRMPQKRQSSQQCHLVLLGPTSVKAARKMLVKLTLGVNFTIMVTYSSYVHRSQKRKKDWQPDCIFCAFGVKAACNVDEIESRGWFHHHADEQLLRKQIPKLQKDADDLIFCTFGIFAFQSFKYTCWWNRPQASISTTFYKQLLHIQIPKAQKDTDDLTFFFLLFWDIPVSKLLVKRWWNWPLAR